MKPHYHSGIETIVVAAIGTMIVFHGFRFVGARLAAQPGFVGKLGASIGGAFTFGGM